MASLYSGRGRPEAPAPLRIFTPRNAGRNTRGGRRRGTVSFGCVYWCGVPRVLLGDWGRQGVLVFVRCVVLCLVSVHRTMGMCVSASRYVMPMRGFVRCES